MKRTGNVPDVQEYLVAPMAAEEPEVVAPMVTAEKPEVDDPKGKRKATENDIPIADITNCRWTLFSIRCLLTMDCRR